MLDDLELLDVHARALFTHDEGSRLVYVNEPGGGGVAPAPRLFFCRARTCNLWRFRADLPEALAGELGALCADEPAFAELDAEPRHAQEYARLLESHAPVRGREAGPAYYFAEYAEPSGRLLTVTEENAELLRGGFEDFVDELPAWQPFVALVEGGRAVSVCRSVRVTGAAHEAGVETLPEFRGRGYAKQATAGWARLVRSTGALPMYSTSWDNAASRAVARKLRLTTYAADFHIT